jgi:hypothetical protein
MMTVGATRATRPVPPTERSGAPFGRLGLLYTTDGLFLRGFDAGVAAQAVATNTPGCHTSYLCQTTRLKAA